MKGKDKGDDLELLWYIQFVPPFDEVEEALQLVCSQSATLDSAQSEDDVSRKRKDRDFELADEYLKINLFQSIVSMVSAICRSSVAQPFAAKAPWSSHRFHVGRPFLGVLP